MGSACSGARKNKPTLHALKWKNQSSHKCSTQKGDSSHEALKKKKTICTDCGYRTCTCRQEEEKDWVGVFEHNMEEESDENNSLSPGNYGIIINFRQGNIEDKPLSDPSHAKPSIATSVHKYNLPEKYDHVRELDSPGDSEDNFLKRTLTPSFFPSDHGRAPINNWIIKLLNNTRYALK